MGERPGAVGRRTSPVTGHYEELRDPANGEKVPRCGACGLPNRHVLRGTWAGKVGMWFPLCASCITKYNGHLDPDPLSVAEDAA